MRVKTVRGIVAGWVGSVCGAFAFGEEKAAVKKAQAPIDGIRDNSFLIEEAFNQEAGVVQHIWTSRFGADHRGDANARTWDFSFTQEWPLFSQTHQFSYVVPYSFIDEDAENAGGIGDLELNYRYQWFMDEEGSPAVSPRFTLILPTGDEERGFGSGEVGYAFNLPISKTLGDRVYVNFNAGLTFQSGVRSWLSDNRRSRPFDLLEFNLGASVIYAVTDKFHLLLEAVWESVEGIEEVDPRGDRPPFGVRRRGDEVTIAPGIRWAWDLPGDLQIVPGIAVPIGLSDEAIDYGVFFYLSIEHPFLTAAD